MANRPRMILSLTAALIMAAILASFVYRLVSRAGTTRPMAPMGKIVVATAAMPFGTRLNTSNLRLMDWPAQEPLAGAFIRPEDCAGRALLVPVVANEVILEPNLAPMGAGAGLPAVIPPGMRAVSVAVNDVTAVSGFIQPGTRVDVLATGSGTGQSTGNVTLTVLQGIRVLAAGQKVQPDEKGQPEAVPVVTLLLTPEEADILAMVSTEARIQFALRNTLDVQRVSLTPIQQNALFNAFAPVVHSAEALPVRASPPAYSVEIISGGKRSSESVPNP